MLAPSFDMLLIASPASCVAECDETEQLEAALIEDQPAEADGHTRPETDAHAA